MGRDRGVEKELVSLLANIEQNEKFIVSSINLMDSEVKRKQLIDYIKSKPNVTKKEIEMQMFYMSIK